MGNPLGESIKQPTEGRLAAFSLEAVGEDPKGAMDALEQFLRLPKNRWQARFDRSNGRSNIKGISFWAMDFDENENET